MRNGGIFNGLSAIGAVTPEELDEYSEAPGTSLLKPTFNTNVDVPDWDTAEDRAAIVAADQAKLDAAKAAAAPASSSFSWSGLTDMQKLGIGVAGVLVLGVLWKSMGKSKSYASNPAKRRRARKTKRYVLKRGPYGKGWTIYDTKLKRGVNWHAYKQDSADAAAMYNEYGYRKGHIAKYARAKHYPDPSLLV